MIRILKERLQENSDRIALISKGVGYTYRELFTAIEEQERFFQEKNVGNHDVVALIGDFSITSLASLIALFFRNATVIPLTRESHLKLKEYIDQLEPNFIYDASELKGSAPVLTELAPQSKREWMTVLPTDSSSLIVFTSGSTGAPKAILHSVSSLCYRYIEKKPPVSSICFLLFDHMGGINTVLFLLFRGGTAVHVVERQVDEVCKTIETNRVELLPTTPSFLSQLLISRAYQNYDLSSLKVISYGTEVMSEAVLKKLHEVLPTCTLKQTYGLSETGVFQVKSESDDSLWFKFIDPGVEYKIVENVLWIKTKSNLLGKVLFQDGGIVLEKRSEEWFCTNDLVETKGDYLKILGRQTDIINVAGLKVYPSEVENCIFECDCVDDVFVQGKKHPMLGNIVVAHILLKPEFKKEDAEKIIKRHCIEKLEKFKVPSKFVFEWENFVNDRFKRVRSR